MSALNGTERSFASPRSRNHRRLKIIRETFLRCSANKIWCLNKAGPEGGGTPTEPLNRSLVRRTDPMHTSRRIRPSSQLRSIGNNEQRGLAPTSFHAIRSRGAIALGILLAVGTLVILFWDVRAPADLTTDHVMTLAMLVVTIAAGHYWLPCSSTEARLPRPWPRHLVPCWNLRLCHRFGRPRCRGRTAEGGGCR
jgi:hypothetical protein